MSVKVDASLEDWIVNPIPTLKDALETAAKGKSNWFNPVVFSAMMLERFGYFTIEKHLKSKNVDSKQIEKMFGKASLREIAKCLLLIRKITYEEWKAICNINSHRNYFLHRKEVNFLRGEEAKEKYTPLVKEAIRILRKKLMKSSVDSSS